MEGTARAISAASRFCARTSVIGCMASAAPATTWCRPDDGSAFARSRRASRRCHPKVARQLHESASKGDAAVLEAIMSTYVVPVYVLRAKCWWLRSLGVMKSLTDLLGPCRRPGCLNSSPVPSTSRKSMGFVLARRRGARRFDSRSVLGFRLEKRSPDARSRRSLVLWLSA